MLPSFAIDLMLAVAMAAAFPPATVACNTFSPNEMDVPELGKVALPPGEWKLEFTHIAEPEDKTPDVFILRKQQKTIERITILRYHGAPLPKRMYGLCDSIADSTLFGLPGFLSEETKKLDGASNGLSKDRSIHMIRLPRNWNAETLEVSNVYTDRGGRNWMNHGILTNVEKSVFVLVHTSELALSPEDIEAVLFESKF